MSNRNIRAVVRIKRNNRRCIQLLYHSNIAINVMRLRTMRYLFDEARRTIISVNENVNKVLFLRRSSANGTIRRQKVVRVIGNALNLGYGKPRVAHANRDSKNVNAKNLMIAMSARLKRAGVTTITAGPGNSMLHVRELKRNGRATRHSINCHVTVFVLSRNIRIIT